MGEGLSHWSSMVLRKSQTCFSDRHTHPNSMYSNFCHVLKNNITSSYAIAKIGLSYFDVEVVSSKIIFTDGSVS